MVMARVSGRERRGRREGDIHCGKGKTGAQNVGWRWLDRDDEDGSGAVAAAHLKGQRLTTHHGGSSIALTVKAHCQALATEQRSD
jgi:hypothetical protein